MPTRAYMDVFAACFELNTILYFRSASIFFVFLFFYFPKFLIPPNNAMVSFRLEAKSTIGAG
jgi:hypothetical protein